MFYTVPEYETLEAEAKALRERVAALEKQVLALHAIEAEFEAASDERYTRMEEWRAEARKWREQKEFYGANFHEGVAAGACWVDIYYRRVGRKFKAIAAGTVEKQP